MPPCKGHRKSRKGCFACKRRRVKCDEGHPRCVNCTRRGEGDDCVYPNNTSEVNALGDGHSQLEVLPAIVGETVLESIDSRAPSVIGQCICGHLHAYPTFSPISVEFPGALPVCYLFNLIPNPASEKPQLSQLTDGNHFPHKQQECLSLIDLSLLHHFTVYTAKSMTVSANSDVLKTWTEVVPKIGRSYPFVMHSILAAAAGHMNTEESMRVGEHHYTEVMKGLRIELEGGIRRIHEENCHAIFIAINLSNLYTMSASRYEYMVNNHRSEQSDFSCSLNVNVNGRERFVRRLDTTWTTFTRSSFGFLDKSWKWIINGPIASIFLPYPPTPKRMPALSKRTEAMLKELLGLCGDGLIDGAAEELADVEVATAYFAAVWNLRKVWVVLEDYVGYASGFASNADDDDDDLRCARYEGVSRRRVVPNLEKAAALYSAIFQFVLRTPAIFWHCLDKKKPRALVIYAYFVASFEALNFGCDNSSSSSSSSSSSESHSTHNPWSYSDQTKSTTTTATSVATWWIIGRAESDLRSVEDELCVLGVGHSWRDWTVGAWKVWEGLRKGSWFDSDSDFDWKVDKSTGALTVTRYIGMDSFEHGGYGGSGSGSVDVQHSVDLGFLHTTNQLLDSFDYTTNFPVSPHFDEHWIAGLLESEPDSLTTNAFIQSSEQTPDSEETNTSDGPRRLDVTVPFLI